MADAHDVASTITHDFLGKELYVIFSTPLKSREELAPVMPDHLAHQVAIEKKGILFGAGPDDQLETLENSFLQCFNPSHFCKSFGPDLGDGVVHFDYSTEEFDGTPNG